MSAARRPAADRRPTAGSAGGLRIPGHGYGPVTPPVQEAGDGSDGMDRVTLRAQPVQGPRGSGEVEAGDDAGGEGGARGADVLEVVGEGLDGDALRRGEELLRRRRRGNG